MSLTLSCPAETPARVGEEAPQPRRRLVVRIGLLIGGVNAALALLFALVGSPFIQDYETRRQLSHIEDMLGAVENTARIATYTRDTALAKEVARGLMSNPAISAVRITAKGESLIDASTRVAASQQDVWVRRSLVSPFDDQTPVGEIALGTNNAYILGQVSHYSRFFAGLLLLEVLIVTLVVAATMLRGVVRPITQLTDGLERIKGQVDERLSLPKGHENTEIGHLARAFNRMIDSAAALLEREHALSKAIGHSERRFRTLVENSPDIIARFDSDGVLKLANPAGTRVGGLAAVAPGTPIPAEAWRPSIPLGRFLDRVRQVAATGRPDTLNWEWETSAGLVCHEIQLVAEYDGANAPVGVLAIGRDISARIEAERRLSHQATHDALTGLPNRLLIKDRLQRAIAQAQRQNRRGALVFIDLDKFKEVNDSLGHDAGDELLKALGRHIRETLRESDTVARLGGDEFVVLLEDIPSRQDMDAVVQKLCEAIALPCQVDGHAFHPEASLGIAVFPDDGADAKTLMRNADTAMYVAKAQGRNQHRFFSADMNEELTEWIEMTSNLRRAIENGEFELHYQPKLRLDDETHGGMEALIRWRHPEQGMVSPARFIPVAEKCGLIGAIGDWVMDEACRQARAWLDAGLDPGRVAVNLSAAQCQGGRLSDQVRKSLAKHGLSGRHLEVEITESIVMNDAEASIRAFWTLREMDVEISVDDFGTGYSSLSYLKRLPLHKLKIDKSFVDDIETDANDVEIIKAIIAMAHSLKLAVIAEGVENAAQLQCLESAGCDHIQGYHYSRPLSAAAMTEFLRTGRRHSQAEILPLFPATAP